MTFPKTVAREGYDVQESAVLCNLLLPAGLVRRGVLAARPLSQLQHHSLSDVRGCSASEFTAILYVRRPKSDAALRRGCEDSHYSSLNIPGILKSRIVR